MTITQLTTEYAKTLGKDDLARLGRFNLRVLAGSFGLLDTEANKMAFMTSMSEDMAQIVYANMHGLPPPTRIEEVKPSVEERIKSATHALASSLIATRKAYTRILLMEIQHRVEKDLA